MRGVIPGGRHPLGGGSILPAGASPCEEWRELLTVLSTIHSLRCADIRGVASFMVSHDP